MTTRTAEVSGSPELGNLSIREKIEPFFSDTLGDLSNQPLTKIKLSRNKQVHEVRGRYLVKEVELPVNALTDDLLIHGFDNLRLQRMELPDDNNRNESVESFSIYLINSDPKMHYRHGQDMPTPEQENLNLLTLITKGPEHKPVKFNLGEEDLGGIIIPDYGYHALGTETQDLDLVLRNIKKILTV